MAKAATILSIENLWNQFEERGDKKRYFLWVLDEGSHKEEAVFFKVKVAVIFKVVNKLTNDKFKGRYEFTQNNWILTSSPNDVPTLVDNILVFAFGFVDL